MNGYLEDKFNLKRPQKMVDDYYTKYGTRRKK
jgi:hypothetical protein